MFDALTDEALESELCSQAAHLCAGESQLLGMIAEVDRRRIWAAQGAASCAHWLSWRIGTALGAAREQLRVAHRLEQLPTTRAAFSAGELSYSKVRAITRIAEASTDAELVELARHVNAAQLEQIVRDYRRASPEEQERANRLHRLRYLRHHTDDDGMVVLHARLDPEEAAVVLAALDAARRSLAGDDSGHAAGEATEERPQGEGSADARHVSAETCEGDEQDFRGADVPAATSADTGHAATGASAGAGAAGDAAGAGDAVVEHEDPWSRAASSDELELEEPLDRFERSNADALVALCRAMLQRRIEDCLDPKIWVFVHVDEQVLTDPSAPGCARIEGVGAITGHAAARLACEGAVTRLAYRADGSVEQEGATRAIPDSLRRALVARDGGCRFPGCNATHFLHAHHVVYFSRGGRTVISNLVLLCGRHHRLVHDGGFTLQLDRNGAVRVYRPDGTLLPAVPAGSSGSAAALAASNAARGMAARPELLGADGDRCDVGLAVDALLGLARRPAPAVVGL